MSVTDDIYQGLQALAEAAFPKRCRNCGRVYHDVDSFIAETKLLKKNESGLKSTTDEDGAMSVELFRNCPCGSTLMDVFNDRRDISESGLNRRNNFDKLMTMVQKQYKVDTNTARKELLTIMNGENSKIIKNIMPTRYPNKPQQ